MIKLSIVTLSYNTRDLTLTCLGSIASKYKKELNEGGLEIIVVDNNSSDDSIKSIKAAFFGAKYLTLIENRDNLGFGRGCNLGAKAAKGEYILFLNSDTEILDKGFLNMIKFLEENPKVAILGGKLENSNGTLQPSVGKFYNLFNLLIMLLGLERFGFLKSSPKRIQKVDWVSGACMMVRRDVFEKLLGFDSKFFMYVEDMEICYRAQKLGLNSYFYPGLKLKHQSLGSSDRSFAIINIYRGILHFYSKHRSYPEYLIAKALLALKAIILILVGFIILNKDLRNRYGRAMSQSL